MGYKLFNKMEFHVQLEKYLMDMHELINDESVKIEELINVRQGKQSKCKIYRLHTDDGTEYKTKQMK